MNKYLLTKKEFESLSSDNITKKQYDDIVEKINKRFYEIVVGIVGKRNLHWVDYDNGYDEQDGYFDLERYKNGICFEGEGRAKFSEFVDVLDWEIPIEWLWEEDYKEQYEKLAIEIRSEEENRKQKGKEKREARKEWLNKMKIQIENKLTKEEISAVTFKK